MILACVQCTGIEFTCKLSDFLPERYACAAALACDGNGGCEPTTIQPARTLCRAGTDACDKVERCDGLSPECPVEVPGRGLELDASAVQINFVDARKSDFNERLYTSSQSTVAVHVTGANVGTSDTDIQDRVRLCLRVYLI